jgi:SnoaL-like domain
VTGDVLPSRWQCNPILTGLWCGIDVCVGISPNGGTSMHPLGGEIAMGDDDVRVALRRHWAASDANDFATEHQIYRADAVLEYPQSGERIRGRANIEASRAAQPNTKRFTVRRMLGGGDLWISELVLTYDGQPFYTVSIMEFEGGEVVRETQYFGDPFEPGPSRAQWVDRTE